MKILFYSTNSNHFDGNTFKINTLPSWKNQWEQLCNIYPEHEFIIITQLPGMFLLDLENNSVKESCSKIKYFVTRKDSPYEIAELIKSYEPDIAIAVSLCYNNKRCERISIMEKSRSWSSAHDWKSCNL